MKTPRTNAVFVCSNATGEGREKLGQEGDVMVVGGCWERDFVILMQQGLFSASSSFLGF